MASYPPSRSKYRFGSKIYRSKHLLSELASSSWSPAHQISSLPPFPRVDFMLIPIDWEQFQRQFDTIAFHLPQVVGYRWLNMEHNSWMSMCCECELPLYTSSSPPDLFFFSFPRLLHIQAARLTLTMGEVNSSIFNLRRHLRETRSRPWLTNSALRRSPPSGLNGGEDAPSLSESTTVTLVSDQPPSTAGKCDPEEQRTDSTKEEQVQPCLSQAKARASKIGGPVGEGVLGKVKSTAIAPTVTEEKTLASRLPVRIRRFFTGRRSASPQIRRSKTPVAYAGMPTDKGVGTSGLEGYMMTVTFRPKGTAKPKQSRQKPERTRAHRGRCLHPSILKHRVEVCAEAKLGVPTDVGRGVKTDPAKSKKVRFSSALTSRITIPRDQLSSKVHKCCGRVECRRCPEDRPKHLSGGAWLDAQAVLGYDYLKHSGGLFGNERHELDTMGSVFS
ncbi:hypothetical protein EDD36DRAFT_470132 [Exophiala viscosa]|uniref:Uncharacterized protein n=1 Tax=Exophiala viscosa TaxID=2486360 RepID=A0AAN6IGV5_9EURO|nr:hypothetical protein EDD36DRAFT_470132 [Exophiala viscosa]